MKKPVRRILAALLVLVLTAMLVPAALIAGTMDGRGDPDADYLIVLGTAVNGTEPSPMLRQRLDAALQYLNAHPETQCVVTGGYGDGENLSEAECMYNYLIAAGIAPQRVWTEDRATNTVQNLRNTVSMIYEETGVYPERVTILSSDFHLFRAGKMADDLGLEAALAPAKTEPFSLLAPWYFREIFALWSYLLTGK